MSLKTLLKALLPGLVPLLVYVAAEALFGEVVGLITGLGVGVVEFVVSLIRTRRADPFIAADTLLLAVASGLSLLLRNDLFIKLKPVVIEGVLAAGLAVLLALPPSYMRGWLASQIRGIPIPDSALPMMKKSLVAMVGVLVLHVGLTVWAALVLPTAWWGFISGGLLYILFGALVLAQILSVRLKARASRRVEILPVIDDTGKVLETLPVTACHQGPGKLHPAVHLFITDGAGRLYLLKRAGLWGSPLSVHVRAGETVEDAMARELGRQLGIVLPPPGAKGAEAQPLLRYRWEDAMESELVFSFLLRHTGPFNPDPSTVEEGRFWDRRQISEGMGKSVFSPRLEFELTLIDRMATSRPADLNN
ncbi:MAG TPA: NUDIX domain-containing protein [Spirochaetia bacterium]